MFDESFQQSSLYFTILEILRICWDWVDDVVKDWEALHEQWLRDIELNHNGIFSEAEWRAVEANWEAATRIMQRRTDNIRARIKRQAEEVKSLRDGVITSTPPPRLQQTEDCLRRSSSSMPLPCGKPPRG